MKHSILALSLLTFFSFFHFPLFAQLEQVGSTLVGVDDDYFGNGISLSENGHRMVIGSPLYSMGWDYPGAVYVYERINDDWLLVGDPIIGNEGDEGLGNKIHISKDGKRIAVGAPYNSVAAFNAGRVVVYEEQDGSWIQLGDPIYGNGEEGWCGGSKIEFSANGKRLFIADRDIPANTGRFRVFEEINGAWAQVGQTIVGDQEAVFTIRSWGSISSDGTRIAVSDPFYSHNGGVRGLVQVYEESDDLWVPVGDPIYGEQLNEAIGYDVDLSGSGHRVAFSSVLSESPDGNSGSVRVFEEANGTWNKVGETLSGGPEITSQFGETLSLSENGDRLLVGAPLVDQAASQAGAVFFFEEVGGQWTELYPPMSGLGTNDFFGNSVSISPEGAYFALGTQVGNAMEPPAGYVKVFREPTVHTSQTKRPGSIRLFPNPAGDWVTISGLPQNAGIWSLFDAAGRKIRNGNYTGDNLNLSGIPHGIYFLEIAAGENFYRTKLVKK